MQATWNSASLTHGSISKKNIDEAVDQQRKQLCVYEKAKYIILNICYIKMGFFRAIILHN